MKKFLAIVLVMVSMQVFAQNYPITNINITLPATPDANTANWANPGSLFRIMAQSKPVNGTSIDPVVQGSKMLVIIKQGGNKVCGDYTGPSAKPADFSSFINVWSGANATNFLGKDCTLPPGDYEVSVQFFGNGPIGAPVGIIPLSAEQTKPFTIIGNQQPPQLIAPADGTVLSQEDIKKPIIFRWTPVIPKPQYSVTYRLSVWQVMQGQTGPQAMKANTPIITKDIDNITQAVITNLASSSDCQNGRCSFVWNVQALNGDGKPIGGNNGTSGTNAFTIVVTDPSVGCFLLDTTAYKVTCKGVDARGKPIYTLSNLILKNTGSNRGRTGLHNTPATNYITPTGFTVSSLTPASDTNILPSGIIYISFDINGATGTSVSFIVNSTIPDPSNPQLYCDKTIGVTVDLPPCNCTFCNLYKDWSIGNQNETASVGSPNTVNVSATITAPNLPIKSFKAELISFVHNGNEACFGCNKDDLTFGNFTGGTFGPWGNGVFPLAGANTTHHTLTWFSATGATTNLAGSTINLTFTAPPISPLACCDDEIDFCIRYSFTTPDCQTCSYIRRYSITRKH